ncbi:MAG: efflux RND transporter periplasmic adaptor subunit [Cyanobacteriota bacterium]
MVVLAGLQIWQRQAAGRRNASLASYTVVATQGSLPGVVTASGELEAVERVNISPKRQGLLVKLLVDEGQTVQQGQPLAVMDAGDLNERLQELQAQLRSAQAQLRRSRSEFDRNRSLFEQRAISANDFNRIKSTYQVDRAAVEAARQRIEQRQVERGELMIRAPFAGIVTARYADPGAFVTPTTTASATAGATSSSIVELARGLEVTAKVPESDIGRLRLQLPASVRVDAFPDRRFRASIRQIAPRAVKTNNVTSFAVRLRLLDPAPALRIGMTADIDFSTGALPSRTLVPTVAVVTEDGRPGVLLVGPDKAPRFQPVTLGASSGPSTQILSGLAPGTRVFIDLPPWAKRPKAK